MKTINIVLSDEAVGKLHELKRLFNAKNLHEAVATLIERVYTLEVEAK